MFSSFLSNFEQYINVSSLGELENITGYNRIDEIGDNSNPKLQFLNQGVNSKELILSFLVQTMEKMSKQESQFNKDLTEDLINLFQKYSHSRIRWKSESKTSHLKIDIETGDKRQLSVKSRGTYYTPKFMSAFMCKTSIQQISKQKIEKLEEYIQNVNAGQISFNEEVLHEFIVIKIVDLSMGIGNFLIQAIEHIIDHLNSCKVIILSELYPFLSKNDQEKLQNLTPFSITQKIQPENLLIAHWICQECIYGIEIDPKIHKMAKVIVMNKLNHLLGIRSTPNNLRPSNLHCGNTITTPLRNLFSSVFSQKEKGFDIAIGNPPWEVLKANKREFFSNYYEGFSQLSRKEQDEIQETLLKNHDLMDIYTDYTHSIAKQIKNLSSIRYSYQSSIIRGKKYSGDPQLFKLFTEIAFNVVKEEGIIALIVQQNFLGSKSCSALRSLYLHNGNFRGIWEFYNQIGKKLIFKNVDPNQRFIIFQFQKRSKQQSEVRYKKCHSVESLLNQFAPFEHIPIEFYYKVSGEEYQLFGFEGEQKRKAFEKIVSTENDFSKLKWIKGNLVLSLEQDVHVTRNRDKFSNNPTSILIYGGKNFGPFYSREGGHRYLLENVKINPKNQKSCIVCRNILPNSVKRIIFSTVQAKILVDNSCTRLLFNSKDPLVPLFFLAVANSLLVEFFLRIILTGINFNYYLIRRIPLPSKHILNNPINKNRITDLCKSTKEIQNEIPGSEKWAQIYAKIEAEIAVLFKLTKNELSVILDTFDFKKLQKTTLSKSKPFHKLTKEMILNYFESEVSRLTW